MTLILLLVLLLAARVAITWWEYGPVRGLDKRRATQGLSILDVVSSGKRFRPASSENEVWMSVCVSSGLIVQDGTNYPYAMSVPLLTCSYELDMTEKVLEK